MELFSRLANRFKLASYFFSSVRKRGVWCTLKIAFYELYYDWTFRVKTGVVIPVSQLDGDPAALRHATDYFPSSYLVLKEVLLQGQVDLRDAAFVDFGCGLGRVLLFASELPLRRIIGVELSPTLCATARQNMSGFYRCKKKTFPEWSIVNADARSFDVPDDATYAQAVSDEDRSEFNFEGHRYFDLARTGQVNSVLGVPASNSCYPIPQHEIDATHGVVVQNPGY